ncbi:MAG: UDP-glucose 4-epimerase GalE [Actinomycetota bacterium]|nr:UDP-glucose 4-epimerase GalE [Actinomycetota bacterium]
MRLLVVGGAGYIGSVIASQLLDAGHDVTVADNLCRGHRDAVPDRAAFTEVDLLDAAAVHRLLEQGFDGVLHFAALSLVGESVAEPARYFRANVAGSLNLLDAMRATGSKQLVFSSTAATYGEPEEVPITEDAATKPTNPYGASKLAVDQAIRFECEATGLGAVSLRYFNVAGASGRYGERHDPETHLIPLVLQAAAGKHDGVKIFGDDYPTSDGTAIRDYIHVEDLARAHLLALDAARESGHRVYNLGNGEGFSVRQVVETARSVTGVDIKTVEAARRAGDPAVLVASSRRIRDELGWVPQKPGLKSMVADAWDFVQRQA